MLITTVLNFFLVGLKRGCRAPPPRLRSLHIILAGELLRDSSILKLHNVCHNCIIINVIGLISVSLSLFITLGGLIQSWDDVESIWKHVFDAKLGLTPQEHPLLMTEIATVPKQQREKTMEVIDGTVFFVLLLPKPCIASTPPPIPPYPYTSALSHGEVATFRKLYYFLLFFRGYFIFHI